MSRAIEGKRSLLKQEIVKFVEGTITGSKDSSSFKIFRLLNDLRDTDVSVFLNESAKLDSRSKNSAKLLGFKNTYPILCLSDVFTISQTLSIGVLINTIKEVLADNDMMSKKEIEDSAKNFNTHLQDESATIKFFIGLMQVLKGSTIDIKSIARQLNKEYLTHDALDCETLDCINAISSGSIDAYEQLIFKLNCSQSRELLVELF